MNNNNPYQAPNTSVEYPEEFKRSIWWKIYFFVVSIFSVFGFISIIFQSESGLPEYISLALWLIAITGVFGFVFLKAIYKKKFWLFFLVLYFIYCIVYYFITGIDLRMGMSDALYYGSTVFSWVFSLPIFYALYAYSQSDGYIDWI